MRVWLICAGLAAMLLLLLGAGLFGRDLTLEQKLGRGVPLVPLKTLKDAPEKASITPGDYRRELTVDGRKRFYELHVPPGFDASEPSAAVLVFHGGGGQPTAIRWQSKMDLVSNKHAFLAVYPAGTGPLGGSMLLTWNAGGGAIGYAAEKEVDDVGYVEALLKDLESFVSLDKARIYATGLSNGAEFCYRLACEKSEVFAAIAPVAGTMTVPEPKAAEPVSVIHFHGLEDQNVPIGGGHGAHALVNFDHPSVEETLKYWIKRDGCPPEPQEDTQGALSIKRYAPGPSGAAVALYVVADGGHTWPGGATATQKEAAIVGRVSHSVSASETMWEFFVKHPKQSEKAAEAST